MGTHMRRTRALGAATALVLGALALAGCGGASHPGAVGEATATGHAASAGEHPAPPIAPPAETRTLPGVGPTLTAKVPANARQAIVVRGEGAASASAMLTLFTRSGGMWRRGPSWPAHNGIHGWTPKHREGDRKSPVGVFTLHDAGGLLADPGSKLPYTRSAAFTPSSTWPAGYQHDFDYVIAIDYNRVVGTSPSDPTRPLGRHKGGNIWIHLDHGLGTSACVTVDKDAMRLLLATLDPAQHPVIVMGDAQHLAG